MRDGDRKEAVRPRKDVARERPERAALAAVPAIHVGNQSEDCEDADDVRAKANAADTLVNNADIAGMVGLWSYNGPAILSAVKEANKTDKVKIIAFDEEDETLAGIREGAIYATVVQQPFEFGYQSIALMAKILNGDKSGVPDTKQIFLQTSAVKKAFLWIFLVSRCAITPLSAGCARSLRNLACPKFTWS